MKITDKVTISDETGVEAAGEGRVWLSRGVGDCVHYWVGTGERAGGRELFVCRYCGARMTEPLELKPQRRPRAQVPPGHAVCGGCGGVFHWSRTFRGAPGGGRICIGCLSKTAGV